MHTYETLFITVPTLTDDEERTTVEALSHIVTEGGGTFSVNERMGRRRLAYPIAKHQDGVYVRFLYDAEPAVPKELERRIRLSDRVLRALTVRLEPNWAVAAKEQVLRDAVARAEAIEREKLEAEELARLTAAGLDPATIRPPAPRVPAARDEAASNDDDDDDDRDRDRDEWGD